MSWRAVARKDFQDSIRSRRLLVFVSAFMSILGLLVFAIVWFEPITSSEQLTTRQYTGVILVLLGGFFEFVPSPLAQLLPFIGLLLGYKGIVGERETGQLKFLLGLPNSRFDVMIGKLIGRSGVGIVAATVSFVLAVFVIVLVGGNGLAVVPFAVFALLTVFFIVAHIAIGLGFSAIVRSNRQATGVLVLFVAVFQILWQPFFLGLRVLAFDGSLPNWALFIQSLSPVNAYTNAVRAFVIQPLEGALRGIGSGFFTRVSQQPPEQFFLADWLGLVILLAWTVILPLIGYAVFCRSDIA